MHVYHWVSQLCSTKELEHPAASFKGLLMLLVNHTFYQAYGGVISILFCRQDLQMRLLSLFVDFALNPLEGKQVWDLGALLPAIASLSLGLPATHAIGKKKSHSNSFDILQVIQEDDANRIKVSKSLHVRHPVL